MGSPPALRASDEAAPTDSEMGAAVGLDDHPLRSRRGSPPRTDVRHTLRLVDWDYIDDTFVDDWAHEELVVREPFASILHLSRTRRYDLLAHLLRDLQLPKNVGWATEQFLDRLYEHVANAHELGLLGRDDKTSHDLVFSALWEIEDDTFRTLAHELGWDTKLRITTTIADSGDDFRAAFAKRFAPRLGHLLRRSSRRAA